MYQTYRANGRLPEPAVTEKATRRKFSAEYKLRILTEAEGSTERGQIGALLRREGLYASTLGRSGAAESARQASKRSSQSAGGLTLQKKRRLYPEFCVRRTIFEAYRSQRLAQSTVVGAVKGLRR